jgi:PiT family inorganic phosphate transporter
VNGLYLAIAMALGYAFTNGLHDAANSIATLIASRAARPGQAVVLAAVGSFLGPLLIGAAVATAIASIVRVAPADAIGVLGAGLTGATAWNVFSLARGLPSSSGHALVGGLAGAAIAAGGVTAVRWGPLDGWRLYGVGGALLALAIAPPIGFLAGAVTNRLLRRSLRRATPAVRSPVRAGQWIASGLVAVGHGANDAQKAIGVVVSLLVADGSLARLEAPSWVQLLCAFVFTAGTLCGGWPIVRTIGWKIFRIRPLDALACEGSSAVVLIVSSAAGAPVSTTQVVASSVVGAGAGRGRSHRVRWLVVRDMALAWVVTLPVSAALAALALLPWRWLT